MHARPLAKKPAPKLNYIALAFLHTGSLSQDVFFPSIPSKSHSMVLTGFAPGGKSSACSMRKPCPKQPFRIRGHVQGLGPALGFRGFGFRFLGFGSKSFHNIVKYGYLIICKNLPKPHEVRQQDYVVQL